MKCTKSSITFTLKNKRKAKIRKKILRLFKVENKMVCLKLDFKLGNKITL